MVYNFAILECLISLWLAAIIWFYFFGKLRRDNFRTRIRRIRDGLVDYMWKNGCDFNAPAYRQTRQMFNGIIRLSNSLTPIAYLVSIIFVALHESCYKNE